MNESINLNNARNISERLNDVVSRYYSDYGLTASSYITGSIATSDTTSSYSSYSSLEEENRILKEKIKTLQKIIADYEY